MWSFYSKCVNITVFAKDVCLNLGQKTDVQDQEEREERSRMGRSRKVCFLGLASALTCLFMHFVWTRCTAGFFRLRLIQTLSSGLIQVGGYSAVCTKARVRDCRSPGSGLVSLMSPMPWWNLFPPAYDLIPCLIEGPDALEVEIFTFILVNEDGILSPPKPPQPLQVQQGLWGLIRAAEKSRCEFEEFSPWAILFICRASESAAPPDPRVPLGFPVSLSYPDSAQCFLRSLETWFVVKALWISGSVDGGSGGWADEWIMKSLCCWVKGLCMVSYQIRRWIIKKIKDHIE